MLQLILHHPYASLAAGILLYFFCLATYRLYLSPVAGFPGPRLAALTRFYEYYYDGVKGGQFVWKVKDLHQKYGRLSCSTVVGQELKLEQGPIVRIGPCELHVNDPTFVSTLYPATGQRRNKDPFWTDQFGPKTAFGTVDHDHHRLRRGPFNRFFSKANVTRLEPMLRQQANKLCEKLEKYAGTGRVIDLSDPFGCMATDIISTYALGYSFNFLDAEDFQPNLLQGLNGFTPLAPTVKQFPWLLKLLRALPDSWALKINPKIAPFLDFQRTMKKVITDVEAEVQSEAGRPKADQATTIFHEVLRGDIPPEEKETARLWQEGEAIIGAGTFLQTPQEAV
ncbi:Cytochrome P450 [Macrophomina phaseolina MS6]|nr:RecName: Full=Cytochrome P450 monooxygenase dpmpJ; AltName: Full=Diterpenoid pyrone biosynthesis cluster protein J [Macrophomina phaseolina MS6]EKG13727.1 Cytochrome P450 [Macrophomina phaseolina MS6]